MSGIVIRHAEPGDTEAVHRLFTQPEVYANTLQVPHPSRAMWQERMNQKSPGQYHLVAIVEDQVVGHLMIAAETRPRRSHVASFGLCVDAARHNQGIATALLREMIAMCDNWLRIERIELTCLLIMRRQSRSTRNWDSTLKAPENGTVCAMATTSTRILWLACVRHANRLPSQTIARHKKAS